MKRFASFLLPAMFCSCVYNHTSNINVLGNGYYFLGDGVESQILRDNKKEPDYRSGVTIIPPEVVKYNFDSNFIIAKSIEHSDKTVISRYWIINKNQNNTIIPIDSTSFFNKLKELKLQLEER